MCACSQKKPCPHCYNWFECCNKDKNPERCPRYQATIRKMGSILQTKKATKEEVKEAYKNINMAVKNNE